MEEKKILLDDFLATLLMEIAIHGNHYNLHRCFDSPESVANEFKEECLVFQTSPAESIAWLRMWASQTHAPIPQVFHDRYVYADTVEQAFNLLDQYQAYLRYAFPAVPLPTALREKMRHARPQRRPARPARPDTTPFPRYDRD